MSTTPKGPKPEEAGTAGRPPRPALDQTFLGVAPAAPVPAASPGKPAAPSGGSAIIAAPMISVSNDRARAPAAPPPVVTAAPAAVPRAPLQGGWQSATAMPRPSGNPEQTMLQGTPPAAWAAPAPAASPPAAPASPPAAAPAARAEQPRQIPPVERAQPAYPVAAAVQHTALASDYLRGARDAALGAVPARAPAPVGAPPAPPPAPHFHEAPASIPAPPTQPLSSERPVATPAVSVHPGSLQPWDRSTPIAGSSPPAAFQPAPAGFSNPEALHGPASTGGGTQASVAPPLLDASAPAWNARPAAPAGAMAPVPNAPRAAAPSPMAGTMLEAPRSLPAPAPAAPSAPPASFATRFEQVPSARGAFSQQGPGALPIPIDQSAVDWAQPSGKLGAGAAKNAASSPLRLILLAALAVGAIGFAAFGKQLFGGPAQRTAQAPDLPAERPVPLDPAGSPNQATLSNRPVGGNPSSPVAAAAPSSAPAVGAALPSAGAPAVVAVPALPPAPPAAEPAVADETADEATANADGVPAGANAQAEATASAESRLAAQGARHAIAGRYAEALPVYRELARTYSQNTAYTAMAHVLEQKLGLAPGAAPAPAQP